MNGMKISTNGIAGSAPVQSSPSLQPNEPQHPQSAAEDKDFATRLAEAQSAQRQLPMSNVVAQPASAGNQITAYGPTIGRPDSIWRPMSQEEHGAYAGKGHVVGGSGVIDQFGNGLVTGGTLDPKFIAQLDAQREADLARAQEAADRHLFHGMKPAAYSAAIAAQDAANPYSGPRSFGGS